MNNSEKRQKVLTPLISFVILLVMIMGAIGVSGVNASGEILQGIRDDAATTPKDFPATDQVIVRFGSGLVKEDFSDPSGAALTDLLSDTAGVQLTFQREMSGGGFVYRLPSRLSLQEIRGISQQLGALPEVVSVEPDLIMVPDLEPNDFYYGDQWHYFAPTSTTFGINAPAAWDITTGSPGVVVAVIDTGITNHVEFMGRTLPGYDFIDDPLTANDGDGRDSDPSDPGDWITQQESIKGYFKGCPVYPSSWHGTHTAGTIGAASNNGTGVTGINWQSKILPVRVLGKCGGYMSDIIDGMRWSAGLTVTGVPANPNPAKVINMSLGGEGTCDSTLQTAVNEIVAAGTTIVVSAGNSNLDASGFAPANCSGVVTVAATNLPGDRAYYSNYGTSVEISAPGGDSNGYILSTLNTGDQGPEADAYAYYQGTSMAAPHVSGVASLLYSLNPNATPAEILAYMQSTVTAFPSGSDCSTSTCGSGIVNARWAVDEILPTAVELLDFNATRRKYAVVLEWETASELDTVGFNLYRSRTKDGLKRKINSELIPSLASPGSLSGAVYTYRDTTARIGVLYFYWLEDVDTQGRTTLFGPERARRFPR